MNDALTPTESSSEILSLPSDEDAVAEEELSKDDASPKNDDTPETVEDRIQVAEAEARQNYDRLLRVSAEFENYKKRSQRDMEEYRKYANEAILADLLSVMDNLERALDSGKASKTPDNNLIEGVDLTLNDLVKIFERFSVTPIDAMEKPFDPNFHQAVMKESSADHPENTVIREFQKGYLLRDRLLRPSMVVVSTSG
ncbi:MAG TPA: nucleotide exchange factor GrpE [Desulfatirhabdiaceae bacterium]|nr:nucleotide exchange factor GrpE [Desulfatirhabdiaceae bacterium]